MKLRLLSSVLMIGIVVAAVSTATAAYFTSTITASNNTFATGTVTLNNAWTTNLPLNMTNLTPGSETVSGVVGAGYGGSINADLYVGMKAISGDNLRPVLDYYIEEVTSAGDHLSNVTGWASIDNIFGTWNKVADDVSNGGWHYYKVHVRMHSDAGNTYQNNTTTTDLFIHAVQHGQSAPMTAPWMYTP